MPNGVYIITTSGEEPEKAGTAMNRLLPAPMNAPVLAGTTVVRGLGIRFNIELDAYEANVYIETFGAVPQLSNKYHIVGITWAEVATAISNLLLTQAAATGSTPK